MAALPFRTAVLMTSSLRLAFCSLIVSGSFRLGERGTMASRAGFLSPTATSSTNRHAVADRGDHGARCACLVGHVDNHVVAGAGRERQGGAQRLESVRRLSVDRHHIRLEPVETQAHDSRIASIRKAKADPAAGSCFDSQRSRGSVDAEPVAEPPGRNGGKGRQRPVILQEPVVDQHWLRRDRPKAGSAPRRSREPKGPRASG